MFEYTCSKCGAKDYGYGGLCSVCREKAWAEEKARQDAYLERLAKWTAEWNAAHTHCHDCGCELQPLQDWELFPHGLPSEEAFSRMQIEKRYCPSCSDAAEGSLGNWSYSVLDQWNMRWRGDL